MGDSDLGSGVFSGAGSAVVLGNKIYDLQLFLSCILLLSKTSSNNITLKFPDLSLLSLKSCAISLRIFF